MPALKVWEAAPPEAQSESERIHEVGEGRSYPGNGAAQAASHESEEVRVRRHLLIAVAAVAVAAAPPRRLDRDKR